MGTGIPSAYFGIFTSHDAILVKQLFYIAGAGNTVISGGQTPFWMPFDCFSLYQNHIWYREGNVDLQALTWLTTKCIGYDSLPFRVTYFLYAPVLISVKTRIHCVIYILCLLNEKKKLLLKSHIVFIHLLKLFFFFVHYLTQCYIANSTFLLKGAFLKLCLLLIWVNKMTGIFILNLVKDTLHTPHIFDQV